jgi:hypothetical protein
MPALDAGVTSIRRSRVPFAAPNPVRVSTCVAARGEVVVVPVSGWGWLAGHEAVQRCVIARERPYQYARRGRSVPTSQAVGGGGAARERAVWAAIVRPHPTPPCSLTRRLGPILDAVVRLG